ncbi:unnamed protein product [Urochloa humidicola]
MTRWAPLLLTTTAFPFFTFLSTGAGFPLSTWARGEESVAAAGPTSPGWLFQSTPRRQPAAKPSRNRTRRPPRARQREREREMAEEAEWKALARELAVEAPDRCERACRLLAGARPDLEPAALVGDPRAGGAWARGAEGMVAEAYGELAAAARAARAARLLVLALHGGAPGAGAANPPLSAADVPGGLVRAALAHLEDAGARAGRACARAAECRCYLVGVVRLLDHPRPLTRVVGGIATAFLEGALDNLESAKTLAQETGQLVYDALILLLA